MTQEDGKGILHMTSHSVSRSNGFISITEDEAGINEMAHSLFSYYAATLDIDSMSVFLDPAEKKKGHRHIAYHSLELPGDSFSSMTFCIFCSSVVIYENGVPLT